VTAEVAPKDGVQVHDRHVMDVAAPFGGFKDSGIGREFGKEGLAQHLELTSIVTASPGAQQEVPAP
jgi:acyl-CoA reductase-like NAD-dependent aldehyde dehydrogenase